MPPAVSATRGGALPARAILVVPLVKSDTDAVEVDQLGQLEAEAGRAAGQPDRVGQAQAAPEVDAEVDAHATCAGGSAISSSHATARDRHHRPVGAAEGPLGTRPRRRALAVRSPGRCRSRSPSAPPATPRRGRAARHRRAARGPRGEHRVGSARVHGGVRVRCSCGMPAVTRPADAAAAVDGELDDVDLRVAARESLGRVQQLGAGGAADHSDVAARSRRSARTRSGNGAQPRPPLTHIELGRLGVCTVKPLPSGPSAVERVAGLQRRRGSACRRPPARGRTRRRRRRSRPR